MVSMYDLSCSIRMSREQGLAGIRLPHRERLGGVFLQELGGTEPPIIQKALQLCSVLMLAA